MIRPLSLSPLRTTTFPEGKQPWKRLAEQRWPDAIKLWEISAADGTRINLMERYPDLSKLNPEMKASFDLEQIDSYLYTVDTNEGQKLLLARAEWCGTMCDQMTYYDLGQLDG